MRRLSRARHQVAQTAGAQKALSLSAHPKPRGTVSSLYLSLRCVHPLCLLSRGHPDRLGASMVARAHYHNEVELAAFGTHSDGCFKVCRTLCPDDRHGAVVVEHAAVCLDTLIRVAVWI